MGAERAQGRGWVRIPASRGEQPAPAGAAYPAAAPAPKASTGRTGWTGPAAPAAPAASSADQPTIYLSLVKRWREAGRTLPGHPDEEWERLISQPCWPGR
ncbi:MULTISPECIES: hypothetical protein [unclassified Streptomyces]|uniref:hypothetical protein n=1 Tax=unclassified Streptomyces TaxID=2593676 RepID=UPI001BEC5B93|nr:MULTISPECIES: hypothetical protein [unclassified Streptomyces]MBT2406388.1 hypothetical protein [Streptomyces sp. ISL-21]MBT2454137.1 hypothetical protein [Streptomyces sp. ISL-86]MBT2607516.1 hypothetical protein [Streptomyces sp. ISL-87]